MVNKRFWLGMLVIILVFGFFLTGCEDLLEDKGYTFQFTVKNNNIPPLDNFGGGKIIKIEFINSYNGKEPVLQTEAVNLSSGEESVFKVSGFTEKGFYGRDDERAYVVQITYEDGTIGGGHGEAKDKREIDARCQNTTVSFFGGRY